jgi:hypothetical protein
VIKRTQPYITALLAIVLLAGCTKNFQDLNNDPNRPKAVTPGVMLGQLQYKMVNTSIGGARNFMHELMQMTAPRISADGNGVHRYVVTAGSGSGFWTGMYGYMTDVNDIYNISDGLKENNYKAIALVYKCWGYSILTDLFGDLPYSQATQAASGNVKPAFDTQKSIYTQILKDLATANDLFDDSKALTYGGDQLYAANALTGTKNTGIQKWKKLCNSLRLRLLLRISKRDAEMDVQTQIKAILADAVKYPVFGSNADEAIFKYPGTYPYYNPYYNARTLDWRQGDYFTSFFIDKMNTDNDPRRAVWATQVKVNGVNVYQGIGSGYPTNVSYVVDANSSYSDGLKTLPQLGVMMSWAEVEFMKAELALKGYNTGKTPQAHYEAGIGASMVQWGITLPAGYLTQPGVAWKTAGTADDQLQQIMLQKYYALFFTDYQAWFEKNRTGYPVLPRGTGIPAANKFPMRMPYPTYLQSLNPDNLAAAVQVMGGDNSDVKTWWEK